MNVQPIRSAPVEFHTDSPPYAEDLAIAFDALLPVTGGDKQAAATLAAAAVLASARDRNTAS
jgi:hypothetical protein